MAAEFTLKNALNIDCESVVSDIANALRQYLKRYRKQGLVVALSGGIDSSVTAALCVNAIGPSRVFGIHMPERDSAEETLKLSSLISDHFVFDSTIEDISTQLQAVGCYERQAEAIRKVIPEYGDGWKSKIALISAITSKGYNYFNVIAQSPMGETIKKRLAFEPYLGIVAATNFKQRIRKMMEYYHADRLNFAVAGTPNRLEYDQGFFVKLGDGAADIKPIAHLYKTQVYQLAEYLGVPEQIRTRPPTTDTYSLPQSQDEFYFALPHDQMDQCLYAKNNGISAQDTAEAIGLDMKTIELVFKDIDTKRNATRYLHAPPSLVDVILDDDLV